MQIYINGSKHELRGAPSLTSALREAGANEDRVAVMVNDEVVSRSRIKSVRLDADDRVEILTFAGGG